MKKEMKARLDRGLYFIRKYLSSETVDFSMVVALFVPLLVDQVFISLTSILNSSMISGSGAAAVSAVSTVDIVNQFLVNPLHRRWGGRHSCGCAVYGSK